MSLGLRLARTSTLLRPALAPSIVRFASTSSSAQTKAAPSARNAILAAALLATSAILYYRETSGSSSSTSEPTAGTTFTTYAGRKGYSFTLLPEAELEKKLREHEEVRELHRRGNPVVRIERNWVGSNEPCEDRMASDLMARPTSGGAKPIIPKPDVISGVKDGTGDIVLASVLDGHAGGHTSELLSKVLHPTLNVALAGLQNGYLPNTGSGWKLTPSWVTYLASIGSNPWTPSNIAGTIQTAFTELDRSICFSPLFHLPAPKAKQDGATAATPVPATVSSADSSTTIPTPERTFIALADAAVSGACAITALVDPATDGLYVASAGDCRAVAGWQQEDGSWRCDVLSEDQMGENPKEVLRMQNEHPASEKDDVIKRGRVQGGLQPTRAFGDAVYKWTREQGSAVNAIYAQEGVKGRRQSPLNLTPPYVTAQPDVSYRKIHRAGEKLKFIILATDGLWDRMTSEEATLLLASYLSPPPKPTLPKVSLPTQYRLLPHVGDRLYPAQDLPGTAANSSTETWCFEDKNAATHLIRNSLGGGNKRERAELLSLHGEVTRWKRDDISVQVLFFDSDA